MVHSVRKLHAVVAPPDNLKGFPSAVWAKPKTPRKGGGLRRRWKDEDGNIYEWDYLHGHVERYDGRGNHQGGFDADSGERVSEAVSTRHVEQ